MPAMAERGLAEAERVVEAMHPWARDRLYLDVAEGDVDAGRGYDTGVGAAAGGPARRAGPAGLLHPTHPVA